MAAAARCNRGPIIYSVQVSTLAGLWQGTNCDVDTLKIFSVHRRQEHCDIRINLMQVSREHAEIVIDDQEQVYIRNVSKVAETTVNGIVVRFPLPRPPPPNLRAPDEHALFFCCSISILSPFCRPKRRTSIYWTLRHMTRDEPDTVCSSRARTPRF